MATIIVGTYIFRYALGGNLSWALQYLLSLKELGHRVYAFEKFAYPDSCYDPETRKQSDDCTYGIKTVSALLKTYGLENHWCFVENPGIYHGLTKKQVEVIFRNADLYIENGAHGAWEEEAQ